MMDAMASPPLSFIEKKRAEREDDARFTASLAGFAATLFIGIVSLYILQGLAATSKLEDCLLQGRQNCERIESTVGR
jgi:hypothetical protein